MYLYLPCGSEITAYNGRVWKNISRRHGHFDFQWVSFKTDEIYYSHGIDWQDHTWMCEKLNLCKLSKKPRDDIFQSISELDNIIKNKSFLVAAEGYELKWEKYPHGCGTNLEVVKKCI